MGTPAKERFVKELPAETLLDLKCNKVAPSKWMSLHQVGDKLDQTLSSRGLVVGSLVMSKGWIVTEEDLFARTRLGASSCGEKLDVALPIASKAAGLKDAAAKLEALKARQRNNLCSAAQLLRKHECPF